MRRLFKSTGGICLTVPLDSVEGVGEAGVDDEGGGVGLADNVEDTDRRDSGSDSGEDSGEGLESEGQDGDVGIAGYDSDSMRLKSSEW